MGYGVVKHTLGRTMIWVRWLAIAHFVFGLIYAVTSLVITPDTAGKSALVPILPPKLTVHRRTLRFAHRPTTCGYPYRFLHLDPQLFEPDAQGSPRAEAKRKRIDVQEALVVHPRQHLCHFWLFLLQQLVVCLGKRS